MRMNPQKTKAREVAIFAIPLTVSGLVWYVAPIQSFGLCWMATGGVMLAWAAYLWWKPQT